MEIDSEQSFHVETRMNCLSFLNCAPRRDREWSMINGYLC